MSTRKMTLAEAFQHIVGPKDDIRLEAYDGSSSGPEDAAATIEIRSPVAVHYITGTLGDLGLARAFVSGELAVHGDLHTALQALVPESRQDVPLSVKLDILKSLGPQILGRPPVPEEEASPPWRRGIRHSKQRDAAAIAHHYNVSNRFYELVLGPSMTYTCATYPTSDATLEQAQFAKYDLVCRKLGLEPGMRLLDVGCGWGGMALHAAQHYGVSVTAVTLSQPQAEWGQKAVADRGLSEQVEIRHSDYRDVAEGAFDAVSSIGLTEHIGKRNLPAYFSFLASKLRPEGRLLNHCITRATTKERARSGGFIDRYVFPDGELLGVGRIVSAMQDNGLEPRHEENLREHYAMTLRDWGVNLDANWDAAVAEVGERRARVWRLYMAASRVGFELNRIQLHQALGVKLGPRGASGMPLRPTWAS